MGTLWENFIKDKPRVFLPLSLGKRMRNLVERARFEPYTREEIDLLQDMVNGWDVSFWYELFDFTGRDRKLDLSLGSEDQKVNFMTYLLIYHRRIFLFLECVPKMDVPKYLADKRLSRFAEWRMRIHK